MPSFTRQLLVNLLPQIDEPDEIRTYGYTMTDDIEQMPELVQNAIVCYACAHEFMFHKDQTNFEGMYGAFEQIMQMFLANRFRYLDKDKMRDFRVNEYATEER